MRVRQATLKDKDQIFKLFDELTDEVNKKRGYATDTRRTVEIGSRVFEEIIERKDTMIFVAEDESRNQLLGLVTFYLLPNIRHGWHRGHVEDIVVTKSSRNQGVGKKMFAAVKEYCRKNNIKVIKLDSGNELTNAHRFYEKVGGKHTEKMFRFDL
ncbi:GNAT family N-acetyltransferase [Candidatus Roizmanbacteria bacterium]|nr:GNAT family N-acetyltransferase [Candidatus Roizmanbacteria bacterium]